MSLKPKRVNFKEIWSNLESTMKGVITLGKVPRTVWNDRFSDIYALCVAYPEPLADQLYEETRNFLDNHVKSLRDAVCAEGEHGLLKNYHQAWSEYSQGINYLHRLFLYLNHQHINKSKLSDAEIIYGNIGGDSQEKMEIGELGLDIWKRKMIEPLKDKLLKLLLHGIHLDRIHNAQQDLNAVIRGVIDSFVSVQEYKKNGSLELYQKIFEEPFLEATGEFYKCEASKLLQEYTISQYMEKVIQRLHEESLRCKRFLHISSEVQVRGKCEQHFVADHLAILHGECAGMVKAEQRQDLKNLYLLLRSVPSAIAVLISTVLDHIKQLSLQTVLGLRGDNIPAQFIESMLNIHKKYKQLITEVFEGDQNLMGALDKACSYVINYRQNPNQPCRSPELIS